MRRRCLGAWLTWMCLTIKLLVSRPLVSALASAFLSSESKNSADLTGQRAFETPNCLPVFHRPSSVTTFHGLCIYASSHMASFTNLLIGFRLRTLSSTASAPSISPHRHRRLVLHHILEECHSAAEFPSIDRLSCFAGVLEGGAQVGAASACGLCVVDRCCCVADLILVNTAASDGIVQRIHLALDLPSCRFSCRQCYCCRCRSPDLNL